MTETPQRMNINCYQAVEVPDGVRGETDNPNAKSIFKEAEEVVRIVKDLVVPAEDSKYTKPAHIGNTFSIGICSLIRDQVRLIKELLLQTSFADKLSDYGLDPETGTGIGTAEEFQGNERDIMIISLCLDKDARSYGFHQDDKRLNVATSRAKSFAFVVYSPFPPQFNKLRNYIAWAGGNTNSIDDDEPVSFERNKLPPLCRDKYESEFERYVCDYLEEYIEVRKELNGLSIHNQVYTCGKKRLDFVIYNRDNGKFAAVEVDGQFHFKTTGSRSYTIEHCERMDILTRAGWKIINTPYYRWWHDGWLCDQNIPVFQKEISRIYGELDTILGIHSKTAIEHGIDAGIHKGRNI
jgi:very-short-patch-repair endonuclease